MYTFFEKCAEEYLTENPTYINHVTKFVKYLKKCGKADRPNDITSYDVEECVAYYVNQGSINCKTSLANHLEAIKAFYSELIRKHYLTENHLRAIIPVTDYDQFKKMLAEKHYLRDKVVREWLQDDDIELLLELLDDYCDNKKNLNKNNFIKRHCLRIYLKISLIAPAEKNVLVNICYKDFAKDFRYLCVNEINVNIPNGLRYNIINAIELIRGGEYDINEKFFNSFVDIGNGGNLLCAWLATFLKQNKLLDIESNIKTFPLDVFSNTTIKHMALNNINPLYIAKITGNKIESLSKYYYNQEESICQMEINIGISKCSYYSYL